jgi:hypothetical protein
MKCSPAVPARDGFAASVEAIEFDTHPIRHNDSGYDPWAYADFGSFKTFYTGPQWDGGQEKYVVCVTAGQKAAATITFGFQPADGPKRYMSIAGVSPVLDLPMVGYEYLGSGLVSSTTLASVEGQPLSGQIGRIQASITWEINPPYQCPVWPCGATQLTFWFTMGTPQELAGTNERGLTYNRMELALRLVKEAGSQDPHEIMKSLNARFPSFEPVANPALAKYGHPAFNTGMYGAWGIAADIGASGECQAICRFILAVFKAAGCSGNVKRTWVYADPSIGGGKTALVTDDLSVVAQLPNRTIDVSGQACKLALLGHPATVGDSLGVPNHFEACLHLDHGGTKLYYPGGAGGKAWATPEDVMNNTFRTFVAYSAVKQAGGVETYIVQKVLATYP